MPYHNNLLWFQTYLHFRKCIPPPNVGLGNVIAECVPVYPGPGGPSDRAEYASVLNLAAQVDGLDDLVERCRWEAPVTKLQYGNSGRCGRVRTV